MRQFLCALIALAALAGCATLPGAGGRVTALHLFGLPVTLNLDGKPGADGFAIRVFATKDGSAKGSKLSSGAIEVLMFDGVAGTDEVATKEPTQVWKFQPRELGEFVEKSALGEGYRLALRWTETPKRGHITVVARFIPQKGEAIYSSPSTITSGGK